MSIFTSIRANATIKGQPIVYLKLIVFPLKFTNELPVLYAIYRLLRRLGTAGSCIRGNFWQLSLEHFFSLTPTSSPSDLSY